MLVPFPFETSEPRPSRVIAEALVERHGPRQIVARAATLGLSRQLTHVILVACGATAAEGVRSRRHPAAAM